MSPWPTKLQKSLSEGPSFQVADCRGASPKDGSVRLSIRRRVTLADGRATRPESVRYW